MVNRALQRGERGPLGSGKPDDQSDRDKDKYNKEHHAKKGSGKFDRFGKIDKENDSGHDESMEECLEKIEQQEGCEAVDPIPIAAFHPSMGIVPVLHNDDLNKEVKTKGVKIVTNHLGPILL